MCCIHSPMALSTLTQTDKRQTYVMNRRTCTKPQDDYYRFQFKQDVRKDLTGGVIFGLCRDVFWRPTSLTLTDSSPKKNLPRVSVHSSGHHDRCENDLMWQKTGWAEAWRHSNRPNVLHVERIINKVQVCMTLDQVWTIKKSGLLSCVGLSKNEPSIYGKHRWTSVSNLLPRQWAAGLFENLTQVSRSGGGWRQRGEGSLPWQRQQCLRTAGPEAASASSSSWQPGNLLSPLCQPGPERGPRPGAKARQEDNHFQQNKPTLSISTS